MLTCDNGLLNTIEIVVPNDEFKNDLIQYSDFYREQGKMILFRNPDEQMARRLKDMVNTEQTKSSHNVEMTQNFREINVNKS